MNITLIGFMGTGKTSVGKRLAKRLDWEFVDVDELIESAAGKPVADIFSDHGEPVFRRLEKRTIKRVAHGSQQVIATGGGTFLDVESQRLLRAIGPVVCLTATPDAILQRVTRGGAKRPLLGDPASRHERIEQLLAHRAAAYAKADITIDTTHLSVEDVVERIWEAIAPWISKSWQYMLRHGGELSQRYGGKYVVVFDDHIVAVGSSHLAAFQRIRKPAPADCEVGIYYVPPVHSPSLAL